MRKLITLSLAVFLVGLFAAVVYAAVQSSDNTSSTTGTTGTTETTTTTDREPGDVRRDDRREDRRADGTVDVSGPCDEAEHANDPRCAGVTPRVEDDHGIDDDRGDDHGEVEGNSGPGHGGDELDDDNDNSGPGGGGGSGHSGSDHEEDD